MPFHRSAQVCFNMCHCWVLWCKLLSVVMRNHALMYANLELMNFLIVWPGCLLIGQINLPAPSSDKTDFEWVLKSSSPQLSGYWGAVCGSGAKLLLFFEECTLQGNRARRYWADSHAQKTFPPSSLPASKMKGAKKKAPNDIPALRILARFESFLEIKSVAWSTMVLPTHRMPDYHEAHLQDAETPPRRGLVVHQCVSCVCAGTAHTMSLLFGLRAQGRQPGPWYDHSLHPGSKLPALFPELALFASDSDS